MTEGFVTFKFAGGMLIVLDVAACRKAEANILKTYAIPAACSSDLLGPKAEPKPIVVVADTSAAAATTTAASASNAASTASASPSSPKKGQKPSKKADHHDHLTHESA